MGRKLILVTVVITTIALLVGLGLFARNGMFARFWADDYCYSLVAKTDGLLKGTSTWYIHNGSRVSSFWFVVVMDSLGLKTLAFLPAFVMVLWIVGSMLLFSRIAALFRRKFQFHWILLASVLLLFFVVFLMPTRLQTLYWRMATLHYTIPIPMTFLNLAWIFHSSNKKMSGVGSILLGIEMFVIAFVAGAHGESSGALLVGIYLIALAFIWINKRARIDNFSLRYAMFAAAGSIAAVIFMAESPSTDWRMQAMPPPSSLYEFVYYTLRYSLDFVVDSYKTQPLPNLVFLVGSFVVFYAAIKEKTIPISTKWSIIGAVVSLVITFGLIVFSVSPSVYAGVNYPSPRALLPSRFALLAGEFVCMYYLAMLATNMTGRAPTLVWNLAVIAVLLGVTAYTVRTYQIPIDEGQYLAGKAEMWDKQDQAIRAARKAGEMDIHVPEYDVVDTLDSLKVDSEHWVNGCASGMYGVNSITALP